MEWDSFTFIYCFNCQEGEVRTGSGGAGMRDFLYGQHGWRMAGSLLWFLSVDDFVILTWSSQPPWPGSRRTVLPPGCAGEAGDTLGSSLSVLGCFINLSSCTGCAHRPSWVLALEWEDLGFLGGCWVCLLGLIPPLIHLGSPIVQWRMRNCAKKFSWPNTRILINATKNNSDLFSCPLG